MKLLLKVHGEALEIEASDFVKTHLPYYEINWAKFIGNRGNATMIGAPGLDPRIQKIRKEFSEHHYTVLESAYCMFEISEKNTIGPIKDFNSYLRMNNSLMAFFGFAGRLIDNLDVCFNKMGKKIKKEKDHVANLPDLLIARNTYLHGKKLPFAIDESGNYLLPVMGEAKWHGWSSMWDDVSEKGLAIKPVTELLKGLFWDSIKQLNLAMAELSSLIDSFMSKHGVRLDFASVKLSKFMPDFPNVSGITTISGGSVVQPYGYIDPKLGK